MDGKTPLFINAPPVFCFVFIDARARMIDPRSLLQVMARLAHVDVSDSVLDACGAANGAVSTVMKAHDLEVATNDLD